MTLQAVLDHLVSGMGVPLGTFSNPPTNSGNINHGNSVSIEDSEEEKWVMLQLQ